MNKRQMRVRRLGEMRTVRIVDRGMWAALVEWPACEDNGFLDSRWLEPLRPLPAMTNVREGR